MMHMMLTLYSPLTADWDGYHWT